MSPGGSHNAVRAYVDLRSSDIRFLAKIFAYDDNDTVKAMCQALPSHLRWRFAFTSPFCTTHQKVNFFPLEHIFDVMKETVQEELSSVWMLMAQHGSLDPTHLDLINIVHNNPALVRKKCIACSLTLIARDAHLLVAMGAIHLASLNPKIWKRSKRVLWLEHCLLARVELQHQKGIIREMWEVGTSMRQTREAWKTGTGGLPQRPNTKKRAYIDEYAEKAEFNHPSTHTRPEVAFSSKDSRLALSREYDTSKADANRMERGNVAVRTPARASSIYSHRPESANPDFGVGATRLFTHSEEESTKRSNSMTSPSGYEILGSSSDDPTFNTAEIYTGETSSNTKSAVGRMTRTVDEILDSYTSDTESNPPPTPLVAGKISDDLFSDISLAKSIETAKRFERPLPLGLNMNNRGEDIDPILGTPKLWKRRSQRGGTFWRYGLGGELIQVTIGEYRDALERYGEQCEIWQCI